MEELAVSLVRSGDTENAIRVFRMTMEILKRNKLSNFKAERFVSIASSMLKLGEAKISRIVLEEAISFVEKPEFYTEELEPSTIASIAEVFSILNELERAKQVFLKALEIADEGFLYFGITRYLVKSHSNLWHIFPEWLQKKRSSMDYGSIKRVTQTWIHSLSFLKSYFFKDEKMDSETQKQNAEQALPYLVDALNYLPNDYETAFMGVRAITINLARQQSWDILREVVKACPQLGLEIINS